MYRTPHLAMNGRQPGKQVIAAAFLVCFIIVSLLSGGFILTHADHEHDHDGPHGSCTVCAQLQTAENVLKMLGMAAICALVCAARLYDAAANVADASLDVLFLTPITAKIRMNN